MFQMKKSSFSRKHLLVTKSCPTPIGNELMSQRIPFKSEVSFQKIPFGIWDSQSNFYTQLLDVYTYSENIFGYKYQPRKYLWIQVPTQKISFGYKLIPRKFLSYKPHTQKTPFLKKIRFLEKQNNFWTQIHVKEIACSMHRITIIFRTLVPKETQGDRQISDKTNKETTFVLAADYFEK